MHSKGKDGAERLVTKNMAENLNQCLKEIPGVLHFSHGSNGMKFDLFIFLKSAFHTSSTSYMYERKPHQA